MKRQPLLRLSISKHLSPNERLEVIYLPRHFGFPSADRVTFNFTLLVFLHLINLLFLFIFSEPDIQFAVNLNPFIASSLHLRFPQSSQFTNIENCSFRALSLGRLLPLHSLPEQTEIPLTLPEGTLRMQQSVKSRTCLSAHSSSLSVCPSAQMFT